jgi:hypothetical protein
LAAFCFCKISWARFCFSIYTVMLNAVFPLWYNGNEMYRFEKIKWLNVNTKFWRYNRQQTEKFKGFWSLHPKLPN